MDMLLLVSSLHTYLEMEVIQELAENTTETIIL